MKSLAKSAFCEACYGLFLCLMGNCWLGGLQAEDWVYPVDLAVDQAGTVFIADRNLPGLLSWKPNQPGQLTVLYQASKKFRTPLNAVRCVTITPDGTLLAGDSATRELFKVSDKGELTPLTNGQIGVPTAMAVNHQGKLFVTDLETQRVWSLPVAGLKEGEKPEEFCVVSGPRGLAIDDQDRVWVLSAQAPQLRRFAADGKTSEVLVEEVVFEFPHQVTLDSKGTAYISDGYGKCLWKLAPGGKPEKWVQNGPLSNPIGIRFVKEHVLLIDPRAPGLFQADVAGKLTKLFPPEKP